VIARQAAHCDLAVVAVVAVVAQPARVDDASKAAQMATLIRIRVVRLRQRLGSDRTGRDLALGFRAGWRGAFEGSRVRGRPSGFSMGKLLCYRFAIVRKWKSQAG
jgi:hypothetical protein